MFSNFTYEIQTEVQEAVENILASSNAIINRNGFHLALVNITLRDKSTNKKGTLYLREMRRKETMSQKVFVNQTKNVPESFVNIDHASHPGKFSYTSRKYSSNLSYTAQFPNVHSDIELIYLYLTFELEIIIRYNRRGHHYTSRFWRSKNTILLIYFSLFS